MAMNWAANKNLLDVGVVDVGSRSYPVSHIHSLEHSKICCWLLGGVLRTDEELGSVQFVRQDLKVKRCIRVKSVTSASTKLPGAARLKARIKRELVIMVQRPHAECQADLLELVDAFGTGFIWYNGFLYGPDPTTLSKSSQRPSIGFSGKQSIALHDITLTLFLHLNDVLTVTAEVRVRLQNEEGQRAATMPAGPPARSREFYSHFKINGEDEFSTEFQIIWSDQDLPETKQRGLASDCS